MNLRLFPLVLFAATSLLTLKAFDMVFSGEALLSGPSQAYASSEAKPAEPAKTEEKKEEKKAEGSLLAPTSERPVEKINVPKGEESSKAAIESRIGDKRRDLDEKNKELDLRENLLKTAEKQLDDKMASLKQDEQGNTAEGEEGGVLKIKNLVIMYETMKTKSAAAIFNSLDMDVMIEVVSRMKPQVTAQIMAAMEPAAAQKLTVEMARRSLEPLAAKAAMGKNPRAKGKTAAGPKELPRIDTPPAAQN
ncbi:MAG: hypothetical protein V4691_05700 [Pseudomonadota bacterium]